jgi:dTDP-4-dehydrorhamnose 3,5-epimerase
MEIEELALPGAFVFTPRRFGDERGWFSETWSAARMAEIGLDLAFVQDNHAFSRDAGVLRGLHCQAEPSAQAKLVRCAVGRVFDVIVDARAGSPTFGQWAGVELSAENGKQLLAPRGFLHAYLTLTQGAHFLYKVDGPYAPSAERAVIWNDPAIGIDWPLAEAGVTEPILSGKDAIAPPFADLDAGFRFDGATTPGGAA